MCAMQFSSSNDCHVMGTRLHVQIMSLDEVDEGVEEDEPFYSVRQNNNNKTFYAHFIWLP
jgi:hypothetical protein